MAFFTNDQIERRAREARRMFKVDDQIVPDVITLIFKLKDLGLIREYERVSDPHMGSDEAVYDPFDRILKVRESVFVAANAGQPRARFTIAHEIGHIVLSHTGTRHRRTDYQRENTTTKVRNDEHQANAFAAALLAPFHLSNLTEQTSAQEVADRFQIGLRAAEIRLPELQKQFRIANGIKRPLPASVLKYLEDNKNAGRNRPP